MKPTSGYLRKGCTQKREKTQITNISNERKDITTDCTDI